MSDNAVHLCSVNIGAFVNYLDVLQWFLELVSILCCGVVRSEPLICLIYLPNSMPFAFYWVLSLLVYQNHRSYYLSGWLLDIIAYCSNVGTFPYNSGIYGLQQPQGMAMIYDGAPFISCIASLCLTNPFSEVTDVMNDNQERSAIMRKFKVHGWLKQRCVMAWEWDTSIRLRRWRVCKLLGLFSAPSWIRKQTA